ncbi:MAG: hypothetical protein H6679_02020 [Epsilonproteobacteria bacterium]|nr:hypothetical protein [Campylobacterota bacterium]
MMHVVVFSCLVGLLASTHAMVIPPQPAPAMPSASAATALLPPAAPTPSPIPAMPTASQTAAAPPPVALGLDPSMMQPPVAPAAGDQFSPTSLGLDASVAQPAAMPLAGQQATTTVDMSQVAPTQSLVIPSVLEAEDQQAVQALEPLDDLAFDEEMPQSPFAKEKTPEERKAEKQKAQVEKEEAEKAKKDIYLNFDNTDLVNFVNYIAELKKINIIPEKTMEASKISLNIREPVDVEGAWDIFMTVLEMSGFSMVKIGDLYKFVPKDKKLTEPLPSYINVPLAALPDNDTTIRYVTFLSNLQVGDMRSLLESMLSTPSAVIDQREMNAFIITDKSLNIKAAMKLINELDQMGLPEEVTVMRLKTVNAVDAKELLEALIRKPDGNPLARLLGKVSEGTTEYFSPTTRIVGEERTNSLILMGNSKDIKKITDFITNEIDKEIKEVESPLHIYPLQHVSASHVAQILQSVTKSPPGSPAGKYGSIRGGVKYFKQMTFDVDEDGNKLIVYASDKQDWKLLKKTIQDLDKPQPQVAIETLFVTVDINDNKQLGGMLRNKKHQQIGRNIDAQTIPLTGVPTLESAGSDPVSLLGNLIDQVVGAKGVTSMTFGKVGDIWGVLRLLREHTNTSVLSQPFITTANKTEATITVGETRRILEEEAEGRTGFISKQAATSIRVTPQINLDGIIRMDIQANIKDFSDIGPVGDTTDKEIKTNVTVADGQVLVLGGFVKSRVSDELQKTPVFGDIPVLGWFFKQKKRTTFKQYLFFFLSPTIVKPRQTPGMNLYTKMKLHQATEDVEEAIETKDTIDPIHNWYFNPTKEQYSHKVIDFANARYQPTVVDIKNDPFYRAQVGDTARDEAYDLQLQAYANQQSGRVPQAIDTEFAPSAHQPRLDVEPVPEPTGFASYEKEYSAKHSVAPTLPDAQPTKKVDKKKKKRKVVLPKADAPVAPAPKPVEEKKKKAEPMPEPGPVFVPRTTKIADDFEEQIAHVAQQRRPSRQEQRAQLKKLLGGSVQQSDESPDTQQEPSQDPLANKRKALRQMLGEQSPAQTTVQEQEESNRLGLGRGRKSLREFLSADRTKKPSRSSEPEVNTLRRNRLKEFLSKNPVLARKQDGDASQGERVSA